MTLVKDDVRAYAIFRETVVPKDILNAKGTHDRAAYELARLIDRPRIPPAAFRRWRRRSGLLALTEPDVQDAIGRDSARRELDGILSRRDLNQTRRAPGRRAWRGYGFLLR